MKFKLLSIILLVTTLFLVGISSASITNASYPYFDIPFNGTSGSATMTDISSNAFALTAGSGRIETSTVKYGIGALNLDVAGSGWAPVYTTAAVPAANSVNWSVSLQLYLVSQTTGETHLLDQGNSGNSQGWEIDYNGAAGGSSGRYIIVDDGFTGGYGPNQTYNLPIGQWNYITVTYNTVTSLENLYVNGTLINSFYTTTPCHGTPTYFGIGGGNSAAYITTAYVDDLVTYRSTINGTIVPDTELNADPTASFAKNATTGYTPLPVSFTNTSIGNIPNSNYNWYYHNTTYGTDTLFSNSASPTQTFSTAGNYFITEQVVNNFGTSNATGWVNVSQSLPPVSSFTANVTSGLSNLPVGFTDTSTNSPTTWNWTFKNVIGNNTLVTFSQIQNPSLVFGAGNYTIGLNTTNAYGGNLSAQSTFINVTQTISAAFNVNPTTGVEPMTSTFNDTSVLGSPTTWNVSFGDGTWYNATTFPATNITHLYYTGSNYTVFWGESYAGQLSNVTKYIQVYNQTLASFTYGNSSAPYGQVAPAAYQFTDTSVNLTPTPTYYWAFGDGQTSTSASPMHSYSASGTYTVNHSAGNGFFTNWSNQTNIITVLPNPNTIVSFTTTGNTSWTVPIGITQISVMAVGAGGAGSSPSGGAGGGGGGAGGVVIQNLSVVPGTILNMSVGIGGAGTIHGALYSGTNTSIWNQSSNILVNAWGGGAGGDSVASANGGSSGGTRVGTVGSAIAGQGQVGYETGQSGSPYHGGGGGGNQTAATTTAGGNGLFYWISGTNTPYANGGGGGSYADAAGLGGMSGLTGGNGGYDVAGSNGNANTGTGGGGAGGTNSVTGGNGGSGIIVISYTALPLVSTFTQNVTSGSYPPLTAVQFTDTSTGSPTNWNWSFTNVTPGNNTPVVFSTTENPIQNFAIGNFQISLKAGNNTYYSTSTQNAWVNVTAQGNPPVANFTYNTYIGIVPLNVSFTDTSTNFPTSWNWSFGDGYLSTLQNPSHVYNTTGLFTVNLTATNSNGSNSSVKTNVITVNPMVASVSSNATVNSQGQYQGYNSLGLYMNGTSTGTPNTYYWMLGDGTTSTSQNVTKLYSTQGLYYINFSATNTSSGYTAWNNATVLNVTAYPKPISSFTASPVSSYIPMTVTFTDTSQYGPTTWQWNMTNVTAGGQPFTFSTSQNPTYTITYPGTYMVNLTTSNPAGLGTTASLQYITASSIPLAPQANFTWSNTIGVTLPVIVQFTDLSTQSPTSWYWSNFGDGSGATSLLQNPTHTYSAVGSYPVTLSVTNINGTPSQITKYVQISTTTGGVTDTITHVGSSTIETLSGNGGYAWTCPSGVYSINSLFVMGGGAAGTNGGTSSGIVNLPFTATGGGNGASQSISTIPVTPGQTYQFVVGYGGTGVPTTVNTYLSGTTKYFAVYRNGLLYATGNDAGGNPVVYNMTTDPLGGGASYALGYTANGGTSGLQYITGYSGQTVGYAAGGVTGAATNGPTSPVSGSYVTYGGTGGGQGYSGGTTGGGNGNGYPTSSSISTAASFYGAGGGSGNNANGVNDYGKNGANGVIILNYVVASVILPPVAAFTGTPLSGSIPLTVQFTDQSANGPTSWNWTFGDGTMSALQNPSHIYTSAGNYTVTLTDYNINATGYGQLAKVGYINATGPVATPTAGPQSSTTWFIPHTVEFLIVNSQQSVVPGAQISAQVSSYASLPGGVQDLVNYYGMNYAAAAEQLNQSLYMNSTADSNGNAVLTMLSTISYNVTVSSGGMVDTYQINPQDSGPYQLKLVSTPTTDTSLDTCVLLNGNTWTGAYNNINVDPYNITLMFSYQDTCGLTQSDTYYVYDNGNDAVPAHNLLYTTTLSPVTTGVYVLNYTVPNTRGENYQWYQNYTRSV